LAVFIDFKKAFDLVDHEILLYKLKLYHVDDLACALFSSYLQNRTQIEGRNHSFREHEHNFRCTTRIYSRPYVVVFYVNDVSMHLTCNTELYADDTTLHESAKCLSTIQQNLETNLLKVQTWCNTMIINPIKQHAWS